MRAALLLLWCCHVACITLDMLLLLVVVVLGQPHLTWLAALQQQLSLKLKQLLLGCVLLLLLHWLALFWLLLQELRDTSEDTTPTDANRPHRLYNMHFKAVRVTAHMLRHTNTPVLCGGGPAAA